MMTYLTRSKMPICLFFSLIVAFPLRANIETSQETLPLKTAVLPEIKLSVDDFRLFIEVMQQIKAAYVDPVDSGNLVRNAIKGMIEKLDNHSVFLPSKILKEIKEGASGRFAGIGVRGDIQSDAIHVLGVFTGTPAEQAGIVKGDKITHLDNIAISDLENKQVSQYMRGKVNTSVLLKVLKKNQDTPVNINVTRQMILLKSVESRTLDKDLGYIRIKQFQTTTSQELKKHITSLIKNNRIKGVIIDLRDNPGGTLQAAIEVADLFIRKGAIVYTKGRVAGSDMEFMASREDITKGLPVSVIINENSASASEVVAGAMQDHGRAIIVGKRSYGKGTVQSIINLYSVPDGIKLTTARYYTPSGKSIQSVGIMPDIKVSQNSTKSAEKTGAYDRQLSKAIDVVMDISSSKTSKSSQSNTDLQDNLSGK